MGIPLIVNKAFRPKGSGGPEVKPGETFEAATAAQARLYKALGWVSEKPVEVAPPAPPAAAPRKYTRKVMEPLVDTAPVASADESKADEFKPRRSYLRRDLTATDEE